MRKTFRFQFVLLISWLFILFVSSCKRDERTTWNTGLLLPVATGRVDLGDIVPDSLLQSDEEGLWHLIINENLTDFNLDSLVEIPDTTIKKVFDVPLLGGPFMLPPNTQIISQTENNTMNLNQIQLRKVTLTSGYLEYSIKSYVNGNLYCKYGLPGVALNGNPVSIETTTLPGSDSQPYIHSGSIDMSGYSIDMTGVNGNQFNKIASSLLIKVAPDAPSPAQVYGDDSVVVELRFVDPKVFYAKGYFGQHNYHLQEEVQMLDGMNMPTGSIKLEDVSMQLDIINNVGADAQLRFDALSSVNTSTEQSVALNYLPLINNVNITRASESGGAVQPSTYSFQINSANSSVLAFAENLPNKLNIDATVKINPLGDISSGNDFIYTNNALKASLILDMPLRVGANNLTMSDTLVLTNEALDLTMSGMLTLEVQNYFPFNATVYADLLNENNQVIATVLSGGNISPGLLTNTPGITLPVKSELQIPVTQPLIDGLRTSNKMVLKIVLNTPGYPETIGLYKNYYMTFKLLAGAEVEVGYE